MATWDFLYSQRGDAAMKKIDLLVVFSSLKVISGILLQLFMIKKDFYSILFRNCSPKSPKISLTKKNIYCLLQDRKVFLLQNSTIYPNDIIIMDHIPEDTIKGNACIDSHNLILHNFLKKQRGSICQILFKSVYSMTG